MMIYLHIFKVRQRSIKSDHPVYLPQGGACGEVGGVAWVELSRLCRGSSLILVSLVLGALELSRLHGGSPLTPFSCARLCLLGLFESETFGSHETFESFVSASSEDPLNHADKIR